MSNIFLDSPVSPDALTAFVRSVPRRSKLPQSVPFEFVNDNEVSLSSVASSNSAVARYRSFDGRIDTIDSSSGTTSKVALTPLSASATRGEFETLQNAFARTGGTNSDALMQAVWNDAEMLTQSIYNRLDLAVGEVLSTGKFTAGTNFKDTDGFTAEVNYGVPDANLPTAATKWTDPAADIVGDLQSYVDAYEIAGNSAATLLVHPTVLAAMRRNTGLIGMAGQNRTSLPQSEINSIIAGEFGIEVARVSGGYTVDGKMVDVIDKNRVVLLPENIGDAISVTLGTSATALELVGSNHVELSTQDAPGIVGVLLKDGPPFRRYTFVDAVGIPTVKNPNAIFSAKVA